MDNNFTLFFIRHGKLLLSYKDHSEMPFEVLADLASLKLNPPIDKEFIESEMTKLSEIIPFNSIEKIYASPSKRCGDSANFVNNFIFENHGRKLNPITVQELSEVSFDLGKIYKRNKENFSIESVNDAVFGAMVSENKNCEPAASAYHRVDNLFGSIPKGSITLFITHDYIMRIFEVYIKNQGDARHNVTYEDLVSTGRNAYLRGFATDATLRRFLILNG